MPVFLQIVILVFFVIVLVSFFNSSSSKGRLGEKKVERFLSKNLNKEDYYIFEDVTLQIGSDTTQIDIIIVSKQGIFVIEVKNYKGCIVGDEKQKQWIQQLYQVENTFQNPIHQNYKHIKFLSMILNKKKIIFYNLVVFVGGEFKTKMPNHVIQKPFKLLTYIKSKKNKVINQMEWRKIIDRIEKARLPRGRATNLKHIQNVKRKKEEWRKKTELAELANCQNFEHSQNRL